MTASSEMPWMVSHKYDRSTREIADRHYNRRKIGSPQFVPPGRALVLYAHKPGAGSAFWITSWPFAQYVRHQWAGAWVCSAFRNEGAGLSSELILKAVAATRAHFGEPPALGMITFVDRTKVRPKGHFGYCYRKAGFEVCGETKKNGLLALQLLPQDMPAPEAAYEIV